MQKEGMSAPWFCEVPPSRKPSWGHPRLSFIWTVSGAGMVQKGFMRLAWGVQMWLGREESPGLYWVVPGSSALYPPAGGPATVTLCTHISLESSTEASGYWGEPRFCLTVKHYLYQIIKLVRYATRLKGSEGKDSCIHFPWRGTHGNYTMNTLLIAHAKSPPHIHSPVSLDNRDEFWELRPQDVL